MAYKSPFEVLRLDPAAGEEEVVREAARLRQLATSPDELTPLRQAAQALTGRPEERRLHALLTHPLPGYTSGPVEHLVSLVRRPPPPQEAVPFTPSHDPEEFARLLVEQVIGALAADPLPFGSLPIEDAPEEARRQQLEMLWQALLHDPRA